MARVHKLQAASQAREKIILEFGDDRSYEFPGDIDADGFLYFVTEFASEASMNEMSVEVLIPMLTMLLGEERLAVIRKEVSLYELIQMGRVLWAEYMGLITEIEGAPKEGEGDSDSPPQSASRTQSSDSIS